MNKYRIMFVEQSFSCNKKFLVQNDGNRRLMFVIEANDIEEAYYKAIELARKETKQLLRLNFCKLVEDSDEVK